MTKQQLNITISIRNLILLNSKESWFSNRILFCNTHCTFKIDMEQNVNTRNLPSVSPFRTDSQVGRIGQFSILEYTRMSPVVASALESRLLLFCATVINIISEEITMFVVEYTLCTQVHYWNVFHWFRSALKILIVMIWRCFLNGASRVVRYSLRRLLALIRTVLLPLFERAHGFWENCSVCAHVLPYMAWMWETLALFCLKWIPVWGNFQAIAKTRCTHVWKRQFLGLTSILVDLILFTSDLSLLSSVYSPPSSTFPRILFLTFYQHFLINMINPNSLVGPLGLRL